MMSFTHKHGVLATSI